MHKVHLALIWHQHQPFYKDLRTQKAVMPWVRLHATKDYYDMVAILDQYPNVHFTVNLVPSLVFQLKDFADNALSDPWLERTLIPADKLTSEDQCWILEHFFYCNWDTMIGPNPRFNELLEKRGRRANSSDYKKICAYFSVQDFLDLQVWFNLAWMDPYWQDHDPLIQSLYKKGRGFEEEDKIKIIDKQREICHKVIEKHSELWRKGQIEISTTPFYHPILPLLCNTDSAQMAMPGSLKPKTPFERPEDARQQVKKALDYMEQIFGQRPKGMWPSEGAVSAESLGIIHESGIQWTATDEGILFNSLRLMNDEATRSRTVLYQPFKVDLTDGTKNRNSIQMIFRDHSLSDAIGFVYSRMDPQAAAEDLITHLIKIGEAMNESVQPPLVSIILDGENCWEFYHRDGADFLNALYSRLNNHPKIQTTTVSGYLQQYPAQKSLTQVWSGSWINSDFSIWIGHPEDNQSWDLLTEARELIAKEEKIHPELSQDPAFLSAKESLYIAEGSDWCWWYGDQNSTVQDELFDELFRSHIKNIYKSLQKEPPEKLNLAIKKKQPKGLHLLPRGMVHPKIDGLVTNYYEWRTAGSYKPIGGGGAMHNAKNLISQIYYGFDLDHLYLRVDFNQIPNGADFADLNLKVLFHNPSEKECQVIWEQAIKNDLKSYPKTQAICKNLTNQTQQTIQAQTNKILELAVPFKWLKKEPDEPIEFAIQLSKNNIPIERVPAEINLQFDRPNPDFGSDNWSV